MPHFGGWAPKAALHTGRDQVTQLPSMLEFQQKTRKEGLCLLSLSHHMFSLFPQLSGQLNFHTRFLSPSATYKL